MAKPAPPTFEPIGIGEESRPPLAVTPNPASLFRDRAERFRALAEGHQMKPYLLFLAGLSQAQHATQESLSPAAPPEAEDVRRAAEFGMPPIARERFEPDAAVAETLDRFFDLAAAVEAPEAASAALARLASRDSDRRRELLFAALADAPSADALSEHVFVSAALQVHFARLAAKLDAGKLVPVADGACPACGGPPVTSSVVGWPSAHGARFCACSLCATRWHVVRVKCVLCSSTKGISYGEIEGVSDSIKAETCTECRGYLKILYEVKDPSLDPVADDVASLGLDMLVREAGWRRGGVNPYLVGF